MSTAGPLHAVSPPQGDTLRHRALLRRPQASTASCRAATSRRTSTISSRRHFSPFGILNPRKEAEIAETLHQEAQGPHAFPQAGHPEPVGGNQQKVILGRWLSEQGVRVLIVDEPTRGIDVGAKSEIYEILYQLAEQGMAIIVVSSELPEVMGICDRILVMCGGRISAHIDRNDFSERAILAAALPDTKTPDAIAS
jgi:L-arabinose transport system ATP-binding protein